MLCKLQTPGNAQGLGFEYIPKVDHYTSMYMWSLGTKCVQIPHTIQILSNVQSSLDAVVIRVKDMSPSLLCTIRSEADLATKQHSYIMMH